MVGCTSGYVSAIENWNFWYTDEENDSDDGEIKKRLTFKFSHQCGFFFSLDFCFGSPSTDGDVAQMVERSLSMREVRGSIPCISTFLVFLFFLDSLI